MIRIRCSSEEVELEGSQDDMSDLSRRLVEFADSGSRELLVSTEVEIEPAPYDEVLKAVLFVKDSGKMVATPTRNQLMIRGSATFLKLFAQNLRVFGGPSSEGGFHVHFDSIGWPDEVSDQSTSMVLSLRSTSEGR